MPCHQHILFTKLQRKVFHHEMHFHRKSFCSHCISIQLELCVPFYEMSEEDEKNEKFTHHFNALPKVMMVVREILSMP